MAEDHAARRRALIVLVVAFLLAIAGGWLRGAREERRGAAQVTQVRPSADGRVLEVQYVEGACIDPAGVLVEESAAQVRLTGQVRSDGVSRAPDQACPLAGVYAYATVTLRAPLGSRRVVDALTGRDVPVR